MKIRRSTTLGLALATAVAGFLSLSAGAAQAAAPAQAPAHITAAAQADSGPWPIVDAGGVQRSSLSINWETGYAIACYPSGPEVVRIQVRFADGETLTRVIPEFGCNVAGPFTSNSPVVAVRGLVGDFANPWHENA
jgi:hypothetical protein